MRLLNINIDLFDISIGISLCGIDSTPCEVPFIRFTSYKKKKKKKYNILKIKNSNKN